MTTKRANLWRTQNFIRDPALIERLVRDSGVRPRDTVYDLGAGTGNLTDALARRARRVIAVEMDPTLAARLRQRFADRPNVTVLERDLFTLTPPRETHVVFANPPFDRTTALVRRVTETDASPRLAMLVLQREAAERFIGAPHSTLRSALLAPWFSLAVVHAFAREDFVPRPSVDAVLVAVRKRDPPLVSTREAQLYRDLVTACFVSGISILDPRQRAVDLTSPDWIALFRQFRGLPHNVRRVVFGAEARLAHAQRGIRKRHRTRAPRDALSRTTLRGLISNVDRNASRRGTHAARERWTASRR